MRTKELDSDSKNSMIKVCESLSVEELPKEKKIGANLKMANNITKVNKPPMK